MGRLQEQSKVWLRLPARLGQLDGWTISLITRFAQTTLDGSGGEVESAELIFFDLPEQNLTPITRKLKVKGSFSSVADGEYHLCLALPNDALPIAYIDGGRLKRKPGMAVPFANPVHLSAGFTPPPKRSYSVPLRRALEARRTLSIPGQWTGDLSHMKVETLAQPKYQPPSF
ncbi:hypothetical protein ED21_31534 [Erythrobacter sp. SD-21]|nr:hypothetical protein ED21_31534 [Erythrobacter sp. SD-21]